MKKKDQILLEQAYEAVLKPDAANTSMRQRSSEEHNIRRIANQIGIKLEGRGYKHLQQGTGIGTEDDGRIDYYGNNEGAVAIKLGSDNSFQGAVFFDSPKAGKILTYNRPRTLEDAEKVVNDAEGMAVSMPIQTIQDLFRHL